MRATTTAAVAALALAVTTLSATTAAGSSRHPGTAAGRSSARLSAETSGRMTLTRGPDGPDGAARFVGVTGEVRNPAVSPTTAPVSAARAHLERYGAALGLAGRGTRLTPGPTVHSVTGDDVVRFTQRRGGLRVIGGAVAVDLRPDRQLGSITASVSRATVPGATYPRQAAVREALASALRRPGHPAAALIHAARPARALYDPAVEGVARTSDPLTQARGVWRVVLRAGSTYRRLLLVDDRSGAVLRDVDLVEPLDRVVCDDDNTYQVDSPCISGFARTENGPASAVSDVNDAFDLSGAVSAFYHQIGGLDLTRLLGVVDAGGHHLLASTVRYCDPGSGYCPLPNAFWNGQQMFYGEGYASADDVVGHEMTHGVIQHNADLLYWGQSGAINESLADVMGEIIDHRHPSPRDSPSSWTLGEDLPIGAVRSLSNPGAYGQPGSMTGRRYEGSINDNGGVHTNSGVGNKTFYLISQGGSGVKGIDGASLTRSATLYLSVIQHLVSGSDYADLADVLEQSCADLASAGKVGFTDADCRSVHRATVVTKLRTTPPAAPQPADAAITCPRGAGPVRVLFDSEKGTPATKFRAGTAWSRAPNANAPANAISGRGSWYSLDPDDPGASSLTMRSPVPLPTGRPAYLWFQDWHVFDYIGNAVFDGGTVGLADRTVGTRQKNVARLPWVNGPTDRIDDRYDNPGGGQLAFGQDSYGYLASRATLSQYAGHAVVPRFTTYSDNSVTFPGWYLDDVRVYTCGSALVPRTAPSVSGHPRVGARLSAHPGTWSRSRVSFRFRWYAGRHPIAHATRSHYRVGQAELGKRITVRVTATSRHDGHASTFSTTTPRIVQH